MKGKKKRLNLLVPADQLDEIGRAAETLGISRNALILKAIDEWLSRHSPFAGMEATMREAQDVIDRLTELMRKSQKR